MECYVFSMKFSMMFKIIFFYGTMYSYKHLISYYQLQLLYSNMYFRASYLN